MPRRRAGLSLIDWRDRPKPTEPRDLLRPLDVSRANLAAIVLYTVPKRRRLRWRARHDAGPRQGQADQ